ncbi:MAG TPA: hypothetical protein VK053_13225 [Jiangellaceae bacterium]|nr:hypothetical protein [Jiangellaceae bacterium]
MGRTSKSPETEVVTLRAALIAGVTVVAGGLILWWSTAWTSSEPMAAFLGQLGGLLVATGLLAVAWDVFGRRAFAREVLAKARLSADVVDSGVTKITDQYLREVAWEDLFDDARHVDIVVAYAATWRNTHWSRLETVASVQGASIRVFLPDPDDAATVANLSRRFGKTTDAVEDLIREAASAFASLRRPNGASVEVFFRAGDALFSCYRFNQRAVFTLYSHSGARQTSVPTFVVAGGDLFKFIRNEIDAIATQSRPA